MGLLDASPARGPFQSYEAACGRPGSKRKQFVLGTAWGSVPCGGGAELSWSVLAVQTSKSPRRINKRSDYD